MERCRLYIHSIINQNIKPSPLSFLRSAPSVKAMAAAQASKALAPGESLHLPSLSATLFASKPSLALVSSVSFPSPRLRRLCSSSLLPSRKNTPTVLLVAQTSEWALQDEDETMSAGLPEWPGEDEVAEVDEEGNFAEGEDDSFAEPPEDAKLFVGNLPFEMDSEKLAELFDKAGVVEVVEVIYNRETERSRGFGFVTMSTVEEAEKAVDMFHRYDVNGRLLTVNKAAPRGARVERTPREFESSFRIYVGNLPWQVDDSRLEQLFSEHGQVLDARVVYDRDSGRSRGFGFVKMSSQTEMDDAIAALEGQNLEGRALRVNVAEERPRRASF